MVFVFKGKEKDLVVVIVAIILMDFAQKLGSLGNYYSSPELRVAGYWGIFSDVVYRFLFRELLVYTNLGIGLLCFSLIKFNSRCRNQYIMVIVLFDLSFVGIAAVRYFSFDTVEMQRLYSFLYSSIVSTWLFVVFVLFHFIEQNLDPE